MVEKNLIIVDGKNSVANTQIKLSGNSAMGLCSWDDGDIYCDYMHVVGTYLTGTSRSLKRMHISLHIPQIPRNARIKKAELVFPQYSANTDCFREPKFGLYTVSGEVNIGTCTPIIDEDLIDFAKLKPSEADDGSSVKYSFDVTSLVDELNKNGETGANLVVKFIDEENGHNSGIIFYGCSYEDESFLPQFIINYETNYAVNTAYEVHTHSLGRFGNGSVDLQCGNLMFESEDFSWSGNRVPVTIKHLYNSALADHQYTANSNIELRTADFSAMKIGLGYKLNIMQSMMPVTFIHEGVEQSGYVYIGENGEEVFFKQKDSQSVYEDVSGSGMVYDPATLILTQGSETYTFDTFGRLVRINDGYCSHMDITYELGRITAVTDGAGRAFDFLYDEEGVLESVTAPDNTMVKYEYTGDRLTKITYPSGRKAALSYSDNMPAEVILKIGEINIQKVCYTINADRVASVAEFKILGNGSIMGNKSEYAYSAAAGRTVITTIEAADAEGEADNEIRTVYTFDDDGNKVSEYVYSVDTGNDSVSGGGSGINPYLTGSGVVSNINNFLREHNFETGSGWRETGENFYMSYYPDEAKNKYSESAFRIITDDKTCTECGIYQDTMVLPAGEYTFSAYLRVRAKFRGDSNMGGYIRVTDTDGNILSESEHIKKSNARLVTTFTITSPQSVRVQILANGSGTIYADAAQLEEGPCANDYNMIENGNFEFSGGWNLTPEACYTNETCFNMSRSLKIVGNIEDYYSVNQRVYVKQLRTTRETFTLSGWAKGWGLPTHEREGVETPVFRLRAVVKYKDDDYIDYSTEEFVADFSPCTEEWQLASVQFSKSKYRTVDYITVYCDYYYNSGVAYFDDIQLVRDSIETNLTSSDFAEDIDYDEEIEVASDETAEEETDSVPEFSEAEDEFGNRLTETSFTDGEFGTVYRSFGFNVGSGYEDEDNSGNDLVSQTDARGNTTHYTVDTATSRNTSITDRLGNKTDYEYDADGRMNKVTAKKADNTEISNVSYSYTVFDDLYRIIRGDGMKYAFAYNNFYNLESIGVEGKSGKLIKYTYKNGNGRLKEVTYANGDKMQITYNSIGVIIAERWYDSTNTLTAHYKYAYDRRGNLVRTLDILSEKEYNYEYDAGVLVCMHESDVTIDSDVVVSKKFASKITYNYDDDGKLKGKSVSPNWSATPMQSIGYKSNDGDAVVSISTYQGGGYRITSHSKTDSFGRKVFDELQLGTGFVSRQFSYHVGTVTDEHMEAKKLKSSPTTYLVSQILLSDGRRLSYTYDAEERITSVTERFEVGGELTTNITEYTYDELGQLLTEVRNGITVNAMTYDNYGNILTKNGKTYGYDAVWKDLFTSYDGQQITCDAQGNPTSYLGHTLTWEKGRQLKSIDGTVYTYNAKGIRTSKTVDGVLHTYFLEGTQIKHEAWGDDQLSPLYDNEDSVCGIFYNTVPYYFIKNLQGDVIAIADENGQVVARYSYDAWGACEIISDTSDCSIATINPFRYRSYYYDTDTGLYYLQSRYYNPTVGRFLNGDEIAIIKTNAENVKNNLFAYCINNPISFIDKYGYIATIVIGGIAITFWKGVAIIAFSVFTFAYVFDREFRNSINQVIALLMQGAIDTVTYLVNVISDCVVDAQNARKHNGDELHHVVAKEDKRASLSQSLLRKCNLSTNSVYNLIWIKKTLHKHLHTNAYHAAVAMFLSACYLRKKTKKEQRNAIIVGLSFIKSLLRIMGRIL